MAFIISAVLIGGCIQNEGSVGPVQPTTVIPPSSQAPIVTTDAGSISGIQQGNLRVFHSVPFASPPVGDLRWRPPVPVEPWTGVRDGTLYSPAPPQPITPDPTTGIPVMSEDCLYLDVWTPTKNADEKLPVMVFFHPGAFGIVAPAGTMAVYNGTGLAEQGVVIVTPAYRLGALGFLAHPQLNAESPHNCSGNYGIMDQVAALEWVQRNIGAFGGDPEQVTIFGESAGGVSVTIHLASPGSKGLYKQALVESGPYWTNGPTINIIHTKADAEEFGQEYAASLGFSGPDEIQQMRNVSVKDIIDATPWPESAWHNTHSLEFVPNIDGYILSDSVNTIFSLRNQNPVPFIIGSNADDGKTLSDDADMSVAEYESLIRDFFGTEADHVFARYPAESPEEVQIRLKEIMTDVDFAYSAKFAAESMADLSPDTYLYRYSYVVPNAYGQEHGAFHGSETLLLFGLGPMMNADPFVTDTLIEAWTRFAKTGNPNGGPMIPWPQYTRQTGKYLDIDSPLSVKTGY